MKPRFVGNTVIEDIFTDKKTGKQCIVILTSFGHRCGYVELDKYTKINEVPSNFIENNKKDSVVIFSNKLYNKRKVSLNMNSIYVHGGITFSGKLEWLGTNNRIIGFDCAHFTDKPDVHSISRYHGSRSALYQLVNTFMDNESKIKKHAWTLNEVKQECISLAHQLADLEAGQSRIDKSIKRSKWVNKNRTHKK